MVKIVFILMEKKHYGYLKIFLIVGISGDLNEKEQEMFSSFLKLIFYSLIFRKFSKHEMNILSEIISECLIQFLENWSIVYFNKKHYGIGQNYN